MDARDLSAFKDQSFDFVNFSFNGIDYVNLENREQALNEITRVLKPGGIFFFSTHNKSSESFNLQPWLDKRNSPLTRLKDFFKLLPFILRKIRNKKLEIITNDYAVINDSAHSYQLFTFYTTPDFLIKQLTKYSFTNIQFYDRSGKKVAAEKADDWIFVITKKMGI
jgi:ubiquinone/menaquinone biosynthesis C-methylase UbiE